MAEPLEYAVIRLPEDQQEHSEFLNALARREEWELVAVQVDLSLPPDGPESLLGYFKRPRPKAVFHPGQRGL